MVSGATRLAAVIGDPVRHSRSPQIHNAAFAALDLDWIYLALPVAAERGADAVEAMRTMGIEGLSVTMPHKQAVARAVDRRTGAVDLLGACNCVFRDGPFLVGDNTDGPGFVRSLADVGVDPGGAVVAVVGGGGAARSIIDALARAGAERVVVVNRDPGRARSAASLRSCAEVGTADDLASVDIIVNATSVGMTGGPASGSVPIPLDLIMARHVVADIVYQPEMTPLLAAASDRGATIVGGLGMLVHQAAIAFELWTGEPAPLEVMTAAARSSL